MADLSRYSGEVLSMFGDPPSIPRITKADLKPAVLSGKPALARKEDPETSHNATRNVNVNELEFTILQALTTGGLTWDELAEKTKANKASISPRFKPLREKGLVKSIGKRKGDSGSMQTIWGLTDEGFAVVAQAIFQPEFDLGDK